MFTPPPLYTLSLSTEVLYISRHPPQRVLYSSHLFISPHSLTLNYPQFSQMFREPPRPYTDPKASPQTPTASRHGDGLTSEYETIEREKSNRTFITWPWIPCCGIHWIDITESVKIDTCMNVRVACNIYIYINNYNNYYITTIVCQNNYYSS